MTKGFPLRFHVEGNKIAHAAGNEKVFRGLNALDPIFHATGDSATLSLPPRDEGYYAQMREWGADIPRSLSEKPTFGR